MSLRGAVRVSYDLTGMDQAQMDALVLALRQVRFDGKDDPDLRRGYTELRREVEGLAATKVA